MSTRARPIFMNFTAGEISPKLEGRVDHKRYYNGLHEMRNFIIMPQGGARSRCGTVFVAETKYSQREARLLPFRFSELQNYIIEVGHEYMRFYMECGQIVIPDGSELVTNGTFDTDITGWDDLSTGSGQVAWNAGRMDITGGSNEGDVGWAEQGITTTVNQVYILTFDVITNVLQLRIGRSSGAKDIVNDVTYAVATGQTVIFVARSTTTYIQFRNPNNNTAKLDNVSCKTAIPYEISTPYQEEDIWDLKFAQSDENLYIVHPDYPPMILTRTSHTSWSLSEVDFIDGPYEDEINTPTITPSATSGNITLTASAPLFDPDHVGALWRIRHGTTWGYVKITGYTSATVVSATVKKTLGGTGASAGHREGAWSDLNGWPRVICFHEGRMLLASNYEWPNTFWGSKSGKANYNNFTPGTLDDDSYTFDLSEINIIRWMLPARALCIGALDGEATVIGSTDSPITPTSPPRIKAATTHGSSKLHALKVGRAVIFQQKAERKIREFTYVFEDDDYSAPDLTALSEHLMVNGINSWTFQEEPFAIIWGTDWAGNLLGCSYDRAHDIVGWHHHHTDGLFECVESIPYMDEDQVWLIVQRLINGNVKRYVEYMDLNVSTDCSLVYNGEKITQIYGLEHLVGKNVEIIGDGAPYPPQTVPTSGTITIEPGASKIYVGLGYTPRLVTNRPEVEIAGTSQGLRKRWNQIIVRVLNTSGIKINNQLIPPRSTSDLMGETPEPFSGDVYVENLDWDADGRIVIEQTLALPAQIVCITGSLLIGDI